MEDIKIEITELLKKQRDYFNSGETLDVNSRIVALKKLQKMIISNENLIFDALYKDLHKSTFEAYVTEVGFVLAEIKAQLKKIKSWVEPKRVRTPLTLFGSSSKIEYRPLGVVLIISPWNYPFQLPLAPLVGALAAGNCAVLKLSEYSVNTSAILKKLIDATFGSEYVSVLLGGREVNTEILEHKFDYIFFTGSSSFGRVVAQKAAATLTPVTLELGGKSPVVVCSDSNLAVAARRIVWAKFLNSGQTCVAPDYMLVDKKVSDKFISMLKKEITVQFGENIFVSKDYGRVIREEAFDRAVEMLGDGDVVCGGSFDRTTLFISPTLIKNVHKESKLLKEEIFAPILPIIEYENLDDVREYISEREKPLALYIFSENKNSVRELLNRVDAGGVCVNDAIVHLANDNLPFGGVGASGYGKYHGFESFKTFSNCRALVTTTTKFDLPMRYGYNGMYKLARRFFS